LEKAVGLDSYKLHLPPTYGLYNIKMYGLQIYVVLSKKEFTMKLVALLALLISSLSVFANQLPIEQFTKHGDYLEMKLSPDGKHIAARFRTNDDRVNYVVLSVEDLKAVGAIRSKKGDQIHSVEWINNERLVYQYAEKDRRSDQSIPTGELFAANFDNTRVKMIFGYRAGEQTTGTRLKKREATLASAVILSYLPDDDDNILIAEYPFEQDGNFLINSKVKQPNIVKLNVYSGLKRKLENIPFRAARPFANDQGDVNFVRYIDENGFYKGAYRINEDAEWQDLSELLDGDYIPMNLSSDGKKLYLSGDDGEASLNTMFEFDLTTQKMTQLFSGMTTDIENYIWDDKTELPAVGISYPNRHKYHYAPGKNETTKWHKALSASFGDDQKVVIESKSEDERLILLHVSSEINPGEYYLFNTETKSASFLLANRSWLDPRLLATTQPFQFTASDGTDINGFITLPKKIKEGVKTPLVTMIHGGPHQVRDYITFDSEVQLLANRGYAVVQINFRGSDGYGDVFRRMGHRQWGGKMIADIIEGTQHAIDHFSLDADKACVYGASYGGYAAMMSAVRSPDMFKCVVGYVGIYDLNYAYTESDTAESYGGIPYLERVLGRNQEELDEFSPVNHADKIKANVFIIHGEKDARVPVINAEAMVEKLSDAGNKPKYLNFSRSGHGVVDEKGRLILYEALVEFLDENIK
jgi:dipeptidyl aminopeptidase/acylaminoacyl peptidase